ncbi:resuscitation-promoting factor [Acrocarpospora catenulata]|uniref:resuscitation-promoting factor n=1 Tax=Acrocarpospora catenulata TaxID=2836182 RepID=UPI001BDB5E15|nr:resuscitation-promoting factor [Acrocarpospora catenulata]
MYSPTLEHSLGNAADPDLRPGQPTPPLATLLAWLRSPWAAAFYAAVAGVGLGLIVGAGLAKEITLDVDGDLRTFRGFADDVHGVLGAAGIGYDQQDHVDPAPATGVADGATIVVRHARPLTLILDGKRSTHMITALNVGDALEDLKLDPDRVRLSTNRMRQIPVSGFKLSVKTWRKVSIVSGKIRVNTATTGRTVAEALKQANVKLAAGDTVRPSLSAFPKEGQVIRVVPKLPPRTIPVAGHVAALNWAGLAQCESQGNPKAYNAGGPYYGLYQFSLPMWRAVGGTKTPIDWPAEEQTYRAQLLFQRVAGRWQGQWPHCGARLGA